MALGGHFGCLYLAVGVHLFVGLLLVLYMSQIGASWNLSIHNLVYHWCPTAFSVNTGLLWTSSIKYNNRRDGIAIDTGMIIGAFVQMVSIVCPSRMNRLVYMFWMILIIVSVGIATRYGLDDPGIESRWRRDFAHPSRQAQGPTQPPTQCVPRLSQGWSGRGVALTTHPI